MSHVSTLLSKQLTLLIENWCRKLNIKSQVPIHLIKLVIVHYHLHDYFQHCVPWIFHSNPLNKEGTACTIFGRNLTESPTPPWFRLLGHFTFGCVVEENLHRILWTVKYDSTDDWKWLSIGIGNPTRATRRSGPTACVGGSANKQDAICYGPFAGAKKNLRNWNFEKPMTVMAEIRNGMERKLFVYLIFGEQKIAIGAVPLLAIEERQFALMVDFGLRMPFKDHSRKIPRKHSFKLINFEVFHGHYV